VRRGERRARPAVVEVSRGTPALGEAEVGRRHAVDGRGRRGGRGARRGGRRALLRRVRRRRHRGAASGGRRRRVRVQRARALVVHCPPLRKLRTPRTRRRTQHPADHLLRPQQSRHRLFRPAANCKFEQNYRFLFILCQISSFFKIWHYKSIILTMYYSMITNTK